jgi:hypothetical protein
MVKVQKHNALMAARGMIDMFAGRPTTGALAAAFRYREFMEWQIAFVKAHGESGRK